MKRCRQNVTEITSNTIVPTFWRIVYVGIILDFSFLADFIIDNQMLRTFTEDSLDIIRI